MIVLGLTGSIGMGKSMACAMLTQLGVPVHDADQEVGRLLQEGSHAWPAIREQFPPAHYPEIYEGRNPVFLKRSVLGNLVFRDGAEREKLEGILHPFVQQAQSDFIRREKRLGRKAVVLDVPLLFETGADQGVEYVITVTAPVFVQRARVLARAGMTEDKFAVILDRQMPDADKRRRSDFVISSGLGRAPMMRALKQILVQIGAL